MLPLVTKRCEDTLYKRAAPYFTGIPRHLLSQNSQPAETNKKKGKPFLLQTALMTTYKINSHALKGATISCFTYSLKIQYQYWRKLPMAE
jgi:hypothetical protein